MYQNLNEIYTMKAGFFKLVTFLILFTFCCSCSTNESVGVNPPQDLNEETTGTGFFEYTAFNSKTITVYFHIPSNATANFPILFVFHGNGRNANDYRNAMIAKADQYGFIVITPRFSSSDFPGGDAYNLGNVFTDGDNPSPESLNPENEWTFSVIDPLFDFVKQSLNNNSLKYQVFGHSAGGQFAHRFLMYKPNAKYDTVVVSAPGWYTVTDFDISYPYGFSESPLSSISLSSLFQKKLIVQIGDLDNDPNASSLRHNQFADAQGLNRLDRAQHFYNTANALAQNETLDFQWEFHINEGADHNFIIACENGSELIFN